MVVVAGAVDPIEVSPLQLIRGRKSIQGLVSRLSSDSEEEALAFCALTGIRSMIEAYPLERAANAHGPMIQSRLRFRAVLTSQPEGISA
jgi:D-arabinose 1-dehydrogenase-like Zn-dependent alcohol dehydrogenase